MTTTRPPSTAPASSRTMSGRSSTSNCTVVVPPLRSLLAVPHCFRQGEGGEPGGEERIRGPHDRTRSPVGDRELLEAEAITDMLERDDVAVFSCYWFHYVLRVYQKLWAKSHDR